MVHTKHQLASYAHSFHHQAQNHSTGIPSEFCNVAQTMEVVQQPSTLSFLLYATTATVAKFSHSQLS